MSNRRTILFLLLAIAGVVAADFMLRRGNTGSVAASRRILVEEADDVRRIVIERKGGLPVVLERGIRWSLVEPFTGSVEEQVVIRMLDALSFARIVDAVSEEKLLRDGRTRADFALVDPVISVTLTWDSGRRESISFGSPTPAADGVYTAVDGVAAVFVLPVETLAAVDRTADDFRRRSVIGLGSESVSSFDIKRGVGSVLSFRRNAEGWTIGGDRASDQKVRRFLDDLAAASVVDFVWPTGASNETEHVSSSRLASYGLEPESAVTVTIKGQDGQDRQVSFGKNRDTAGGLVYALIHNGGAIVTIPAALRDVAVQDRALFADTRLFAVDGQTVSSYSIADGDMTCALTRDANGVWALESPISAMADATVAEDVLKRILALTTADVSGTGVLVSLSTNVAAVRVSRGSVLDGRGLECFRSRDVLRIDPLLVQRIVRTPQGKDGKPDSVVFVRDRKVWSVERSEGPAAVSGAGVETVLSVLNPLVAVRVERLKVSAAELNDFGLARPFITIAIDQDREDAVRRNILIGGKTEGGRYATVGSSDAVFVIADEIVTKLMSPVVER